MSPSSWYATIDEGTPLRVSFTIRNTGSRAGAEIAQVYLGLPASANEPPKRLVGWVKVELEPGETRETSVMLVPKAASRPLSYWNVDTNGWEMVSGDYQIYVGASSRDIRLTGMLHVHPVKKEKG
jgi:beta-glucosidase